MGLGRREGFDVADIAATGLNDVAGGVKGASSEGFCRGVEGVGRARGASAADGVSGVFGAVGGVTGGVTGVVTGGGAGVGASGFGFFAWWSSICW